MSLRQDDTAAFILRVWCESNRGGMPPMDWRGSIEHIPSGRRLCFRDTADIAAFVRPYIESLLGDRPPLQ